MLSIKNWRDKKAGTYRLLIMTHQYTEVNPCELKVTISEYKQGLLMFSVAVLLIMVHN